MLRVKLYERANGLFLSAAKVFPVLHQGFWLGLIEARHLESITNVYYNRHSRYTSESYNLSGLLYWETEAIRTYFHSCRKILVGGAGGGREALALSRMDIDITAFDCNENLVSMASRIADKEGLSIRMHHVAPSNVPHLDTTFDGVLIGWGAYMHVSGSKTRISFLKSIRQLVQEDTPLLLSFFTRNPDSKRFRYIQRIASAIRTLRRSTIPVELGDTLDGTLDHYFTQEELADELQAGGFKIVHYDEHPYGHAVALAR